MIEDKDRDLEFFQNTGDSAAFERLCNCYAEANPEAISLGLRNPLEILIRLEIEIEISITENEE